MATTRAFAQRESRLAKAPSWFLKEEYRRLQVGEAGDDGLGTYNVQGNTWKSVNLDNWVFKNGNDDVVIHGLKNLLEELAEATRRADETSYET